MTSEPIELLDSNERQPSFVENYLAFLLAKASHIVSSGFHQKLKQHSIPISTWRILGSCQHQERTVGELAELVLLNQPAMSKALDRIEKDDLIKRRKDPRNRRAVYISLTDKGLALVDELIPLANEHEQQIFSELSPEEKQQLAELLRRTINLQVAK